MQDILQHLYIALSFGIPLMMAPDLTDHCEFADQRNDESTFRLKTVYLYTITAKLIV